MKQLTFRRLTITGLVLSSISSITAAILPKNDVKKVNGVLQNTNAGDARQSCTVGTGGQCTLTVEVLCEAGYDGLLSRTTTPKANCDVGTSLITTGNGIDKVRSITQNSSGAVVNDIHTSVAN